MDKSVLTIDLAAGMISQSVLDRIHGLAQLEHSIFDIHIKNISAIQVPRLIVDYGQFALASAMTGAVDFEARLQALELAFKLRTNEIKR
jgi:hypothetical protein